MTENNDALNVVSKLELEDYRTFNRYFNRKKLFISLGLYLSVFIGVLLILSGQESGSKKAIVLIIGLVVGTLFTSLIALIDILILNFRSKRIFDSNKLLRYEQTFSFSDFGIEIKTETTASMVKWEDLYKITEGDKAFYLFISKNQAFIMPRRFFANPEEIEIFISLVKSHLDGKKASLPSFLKKS